MSVLLFVYEWYTLGCIKYASSGLLWRSSVERPESDVELLERHGDAIQILQLQGFIFFGNAEMVRRRVEAMLAEDLENEGQRVPRRHELAGQGQGRRPSGPASGPLLARDGPRGNSSNQALSPLRETSSLASWPDPLAFVVLDLTLVMGLDQSAIVALEDTVAAAQAHQTPGDTALFSPPRIVLAGASPRVQDRLARSQVPLLNDQSPGSGVPRFGDLDEALSHCEDELLACLASRLERSLGPGGPRHDRARRQGLRGASRLVRASSAELDGFSQQADAAAQLSAGGGPRDLSGVPKELLFKHWLRIAEQRHRCPAARTESLLDLAHFTSVHKWRKGEVLMTERHGDARRPRNSAGLYFIVQGLISKKRVPAQSINSPSMTRLLKLDRAALHAGMREFRFARFGPGWALGLEELFSGHRTAGVFAAESDCVVLFLPFGEVERLELERPELVMHLLRLLGTMMAVQFTRTKERLSHVMDAMATSYTRQEGENLPSRRTMSLVASLAGGLRGRTGGQ